MPQILHWPWRAVPHCPHRWAVALACVARVGPAVLVPLKGVLEMECGGKGFAPLAHQEAAGSWRMGC